MKTKIVYSSLILLAVAFMFINPGCKPKKSDMDSQLKEFLGKYNAKYIPLYKSYCMADWVAQISGKKADFDKRAGLEMKMNEIYSNKADFAVIKMIYDSKEVKDSMLQRVLINLYNSYLGSQVDTSKLNACTRIQTLIQQKYNNFRAIVGKDTFTDNQIEETLKNSTDNKLLKEVWMQHKSIGKLVNQDLIKLIKLRNEIAKSLGFSNYHQMSLKLSEQDPEQIASVFDELDNLTKDAFAKAKGEIDDYYAKRYKLKKDELMPWHYQNRFFQEAPKIYKVDMDKYYKGKDLVKLVGDYYRGNGMNIDDLIAKSDLFEKPGKCQHAFCTDIDRQGDTRVLCNVKSNENWMGTLLHEFGHSAYEKYLDTTMAWVLRSPAHTFTTEGIAELFGRFSSNPQWMLDMGIIDQKEKDKIASDCYNSLRLQMLVFSRWSQVMYRFEKSLYENPDQDLNKLWWDLVERYQLLKKPEGRNEPDWASKIHIASSPCYYHNYLLGEMFASQFYYYINTKILNEKEVKDQSWVNKPEVGKFLIKYVFAPGQKYFWNDMIERATGEKLTAKYYAKQFVGK